MGLLNISEQTAVPLDTIRSDAPPATRHGAWWVQLEKLAEDYINSTAPTDGVYKELARFNSPAGARVKAKQLEAKNNLPGDGTFHFKVQTWLDDKGKRHSSLYGAYEPTILEYAAAQAARDEADAV